MLLLMFKKINDMKTLIKFAAIAAASASIFACNKIEESKLVNDQIPESPMTKAIGDKTPIMACYVETNDVNPLNAGDYYFGDGLNEPFFDIVELFASNIHKDDETGDPTLFLNDKLANVLENGGVNTYVRPLQNDYGIKVLLTVLGDWQGIGLSNMTDSQADKFATILAYAVEKYGLDGIGFDDEYSGTDEVNNTSYSRIITKLHELMPADKLITVFDWGGTETISSTAASYIDYAYHGYFGNYLGVSTSDIAGMNTPRWSPVSINMGNYNIASIVRSQASRAKSDGYGAMMCFNLRPSSDRDPLPTLQAISDGAYNGRIVTREGGDRPRTAEIDPDGFTITYEMATAN